MKRLILILFLAQTKLTTVYASEKILPEFFAGLAPDSYRDLRDIGCLAIPDSLPDLNSTIISFVNSKMHKKVGRGECWDLAAEALNATGAKWDGKFHFGRKLEKDEVILPGDIIQFEGVKIKFEEGKAKYTEVMKHHTGIVYSMKGQRSFDMANQNTSAHGRKVAITFIDLDQVTSGNVSIYRPVRE
jgi:hypothetical protein